MDGSSGITQWYSYANTGSGFAPTETPWRIPFRAFRVSEQGSASSALTLHTVTDLDGDQLTDFVTTFEFDGPVGRTAWRIHRGCGP